MKKENLAFQDGQESVFEPSLRPQSVRKLFRFVSRLNKEFHANQKLSRTEIIDIFRREALESINDGEDIKLSFAKSVLLDLASQDWSIKINGKSIYIKAPSLLYGNPQDIKDRIRKGHLVERDSKLREPNIVGFIKSMESRRITSKGWHSIFSLMRDGQDLSRQLKTVRNIHDSDDRLSHLSTAISPYLQFVEPDTTCEFTGLKLSDIWRYFRLTWVSVHKSVPGRSIMILIRDAAAPNHPVIGIAALGSSVVQQSIRDNWIEWDSEGFVNKYLASPKQKITNWFIETLHQSIDEIYIKDLVKDGVIKRKELTSPDAKTIASLKKEADKAIRKHRLFPRKSISVDGKKLIGDKFWEESAKTYLFRSKRCNTLASLLTTKITFNENGFLKKKITREVLRSTEMKKPLRQLVRMAKSRHVGINMMDITVCGALAPYNTILGGKLVCLMLSSPEVTNYYNKKYGKHVSIIASSMKGSEIYRKPRLVLLCTTSLYGSGSSQYNRIKVPVSEFGSKEKDYIQFVELGLSIGFGSFHLSSDTISLANTLIARHRVSRKVNSIFGEGVNPLMRKIRDALNILDLSGEVILFHGNKRIVYGMPLAKNFREILLGIEQKPKYIIPQNDPKFSTEVLVDYWKRRWLSNRINSDEVIAKIEQHTHAYPITHGARVPKIADKDNAQFDFQFLSTV